MPHPIEPSTLRILKPTGETVGTGFLVSENLAVTCAHVVKILGASAGDTIDIRFTGKSAATTARILPEFWRPDDSTDIAILQVDEVPAGVFPLRMARASESRLKSDLYTFGYAIAADEQGIGGLGTFITLKQEGNFIQFRMHEANHGHSGAPIYDDKRGVVVGMIKKGHTRTGRNAETTFAIPTETIWQICPQIKPPTPVLPRRNPIVEGINLLPYDYDQRIQNFLTEYLGTDSHPVPFGGRDDALKMLDTWLAKTTPYLVLAAPAGRGKSALLVRWLDRLKAREDLALAFVPVSIRFGTNMERVFYAALSARLAYLHGDDVPASPETSTAVYRGLVSDYLSKPLANGRTLLVVLDGLDEAADWQAGADFMPGELPVGVRMAVSARFLAGDADSTPWLRRLNWERNGLASAPSLTPLNQEGVRDVLFKMGCPLDELSRNVDIVAELYRLSEGDPLLVSLYVNDLWEKGEAVARLKPENLADIQPGYKGYFDRWWEDQKRLWGKDKPWLEKHVRAVRNLLAGALGPLFKNDFQALDPKLESDYIADALDVLQRFIIGNNQSQGYTFSHPKLGQYFWEPLTSTEQMQVEEMFLAWCEQIFQEFIDGKRDPKKKAEVPVYVVRNYGAHLTRANSPIERWLALIHHQEWAQAWFTVEGAYGGYLQDVQRIWGQCRLLDRQMSENTGKPIYISQQIRCGLIESSLHNLAGKLPTKLIPLLIKSGFWTLHQAWVFIHQISELELQSQAITEIIPYLDKEHLPEALDIARATKDIGKRAFMLSILAQRLPGVAEEALETARRITHERERARVLSILTQCLPKLVEEAFQTAQAILRENTKRHNDEYIMWEYAYTLKVLAQHFPEENLEQILDAAWSIPNESNRAIVLRQLAQRLPERGLEKILENSQKMTDLVSRTEILSALANKLPDAGNDAENILDLVRAIKNNSIRAQALSNLIPCLPRKFRKQVFVESITASYMIPSLAEGEEEPEEEIFYPDVLLKYLAPNLSPDLMEQASSETQKINDRGMRGEVLISLAGRVSGNQQKIIIGEVLKTAWVIDDGHHSVRTILALNEYLSIQFRNLILMYALELARNIMQDENRASALISLVPRMPENQKTTILTDALIAARKIPLKSKRVEIMCDLARLLPFEKREATLLEAFSISLEVGMLGEEGEAEEEEGDPTTVKDLFIPGYRDGFVPSYVLSTLPSYHPTELINRLLALTLEDGYYLSDIIPYLTPFLSKEQLSSTLEIVSNRQGMNSDLVCSHLKLCLSSFGMNENAKKIAEALPSFISPSKKQNIPINTMDENRGYLIGLDDIIKKLLESKNLERKKYLTLITELAFTINYFGEEAAMLETAQTIRDVTTWWP